jgi:cytochrome c5
MDERDPLVTVGSLRKMHRDRQNSMGSRVPAALLLLGWLALTLLPAKTGYGTLAAQTDTQVQAKSPPAESPLPDGPGKDVVQRACTQCHDLKVITSKRATEDEWAKTVNDMINRGAVLSDDEADAVIDYLSKHFKPAESNPKQQPDTATQK